MRVLHLTDHYLPVLGGIETHVAALATRHAARGDDVTVLTSTPATADGRYVDDRGPVHVHRARSLLDGSRFDFRAYDVVHAHVSVVAPFSAPLAALASRRGVPTVVTVHSLWNGMGPIPTAAAGLAGLRTAPVVWTAVSRVAAQHVAVRVPGHPHVPVLPNAVEVPPRAKTPAAGESHPVRLVSTMRIARRKRPHQLLGMFEELRRSVGREVELTVVGDGPLRSGLEHRVRRAGLREVVRVTGRLDPEDVLAELSRADVYVAPAVLESFGLATLEARSVGLPVVGHAASGMRDFVRDGVEGWLCSSDAAIVERLVQLVEDDDLRRRISEHNRTVRPTLTWDNALDHADAAYVRARLTARHAERRAVRAGVRG